MNDLWNTIAPGRGRGEIIGVIICRGDTIMEDNNDTGYTENSSCYRSPGGGGTQNLEILEIVFA